MSRQADIIPLRRDAAPEPPLRRRRGNRRFCGHRAVEVDETARRVYCRSCGCEVDAFDTLAWLAHDFDRYTDALEAAQHAAKGAQERLAELRREERNAKARARRRAG